MLNLNKLELALANRSELENLQSTDKALIKHMEAAKSITLTIDKNTLGLAYHVHCMKGCLEGNTFGFPTDFLEFAQKHLGVKKAQAYNLNTIGENVVQVPTTEIYVDRWTWSNIIEHCTHDGQTDWNEARRRAAVCSTLGGTKILTVCRMLNSYDIADEDIRAYLTDTKNEAYSSTVKDFEKRLKEPYKLLTTTNDEKPTETTTEPTETATESTETTTTPTEKLTEKAYLIPETVINEVYPELCRVAEECPHIASLVHLLHELGFAEKPVETTTEPAEITEHIEPTEPTERPAEPTEKPTEKPAKKRGAKK